MSFSCGGACRLNLYCMHTWVPLLCFLLLFCLQACNGSNSTAGAPGGAPQREGRKMMESFERGTKRSYNPGRVQLATGTWQLDGAMIGNSAKDHKAGKAALRLADSGTVTMLFEVPDVTAISLRHSVYDKDKPASWTVWYAPGSNGPWKRLGQPVSSTASSMTTVSFPVRVSGPVRFQIRKTGGGRVNIDDITIQGGAESDDAPDRRIGAAETAGDSRDDNMALGNPSGAMDDPRTRDNYLMVKPQYTLSYNNAKGIPNWVSWHLSPAWRGNADRTDKFAIDQSLPQGFTRISNMDYSLSGFNRGHLCPSEDRDGSTGDNEATFLMTNMTPQAPKLNQQPWMWLEEYCRDLARNGNELYIIAGGYGMGGEGERGPAEKIANGRVTVPAHFWKVIVVLPEGGDDLARINAQTRVIAVDMPNNQSVEGQKWKEFLTTVDQLESATGYDFLNKVPKAVQQVLESRKDTGER